MFPAPLEVESCMFELVLGNLARSCLQIKQGWGCSTVSTALGSVPNIKTKANVHAVLDSLGEYQGINESDF